MGDETVTSLAKRKTRLSVEFSDCIRERGKLREVTMVFTPYGITVRLKGLRSSFDVSPASIYNLAVAKDVERKRAEKKAKKAKR
jgi:hypothetical protein